MAKKTFPVRALNNRIVIEPLDAADASPGGILIPDMAKKKPTRGSVVAVGPGRCDAASGSPTWVTPGVSVGDVVLYAQFSGTEFEFEGSRYVALDASELLAVINPKE